MTTSTVERIEEKGSELNEAIASGGNAVSLAIHHAVLAGGEPTRRIADVLHGTWLGHPLHPVLTDITIGGWSMGVIFDVAAAITGSDDMRDVAEKTIIAGTIAAIPTAITGLADFSVFPEWSGTAATWHGMINTVGVGLYAWSIRERRRGNHGKGAIISTIAFGASVLSAWLGGHMVYKQKVGVSHREAFQKPKRWTPVLESSQLRQRKLKRVDFENKGILLYRDGESLYAIGSVCSHAGGPLEEGKVQGTCVQCPWHDSVFDLRDGRIVHGPAHQPQPCFDARDRNGQIEIRLVEEVPEV